jgi:hypothetical protein
MSVRMTTLGTIGIEGMLLVRLLMELLIKSFGG